MTYDDRTLWKHLDGELPTAEAAAIDAAVARDPALGDRLGRLREIAAAVRAGAPKPPPDFAAATVARALKAPAPVLELEDARRFLRRMLVAAAVLAALGLTYLVADILPRLLDTPLLADPLGK